MKKRIGQWFAFSLLFISMTMAFQNVLSDDTAVRELAKRTVLEESDCPTCRIEGFRGERGMIHETIEYDLAPGGHYVVKCRRKFILAGDYACVVTEGHVPTTRTQGKPASSATPRPSH